MNELNYAVILGETMNAADFPVDLYIPPQALRIFLETFTGPLDLLLYLIKKQNLDILDIPVAKITAQYVEYLELMQELKLDLVAEYLVMASILAEIKSRLLLPYFANTNDGDELVAGEEDPRSELIRRLQEYERYKQAAEHLDNLPRLDRDIFMLAVAQPEIRTERQLPQLLMKDLLLAFNDLLQRASVHNHHQIRLDHLSVRERMSQILDKLQKLQNEQQTLNFADIFYVEEGKLGVVVSFLAVLELLRQEMIVLVQVEPFGSIYLKT